MKIEVYRAMDNKWYAALVINGERGARIVREKETAQEAVEAAKDWKENLPVYVAH